VVTSPPTVVVADDHAPTREVVVQILRSGGFDVVADAPDAARAIAAALEHQPDVCVLDINMPGSGIEAARTISDELPSTSVVMLTVMVDDDHLFDALQAGACGYIVKGTEPEIMVTTLGRVLDGEPALSPGIAMRIIDHLNASGTRRVHVPDRGTVRLSPREAEVLDMLRQGMRTDTIARRLYISPVTVRSHVAAILKKLGASDRGEAVRMVDRTRV